MQEEGETQEKLAVVDAPSAAQKEFELTVGRVLEPQQCEKAILDLIDAYARYFLPSPPSPEAASLASSDLDTALQSFGQAGLAAQPSLEDVTATARAASTQAASAATLEQQFRQQQGDQAVGAVVAKTYTVVYDSSTVDALGIQDATLATHC